MTKSKNTKRALLLSVISMLLCVAMLAGSTFAWFTDSVNSGKNRIVAGNLDAQLFYKTGNMTDWRDVESLKPDETAPFFRSAGGDKILWEPGAIGVTSFKVENVGTLAFKYAIALLAVKYNQLDGRDLRDVIKFAVINGELPEGSTAEDARNLNLKNYSAFPDFTKRSALRPNDGVDNSGEDQEIFTVVAYWKPNSDNIDNLYNVSNGKIATELDGSPSEENRLYIDIDIRLNAWQDTVEADSFDEQYDAMADVLDTFPDGCYTVTEHESWVELDIYTGRSTADINISYTGYAPDNTNKLMEDWKTDASGTITRVTANGNTHLIFFKTAAKGNFVLTQDGRVLPKLTVNEDEPLRVYSARKAVAAMAMSAASSVSDEAGMQDVINNLNANGGETTVELSSDIVLTGELKLTNGTLTILGEGHSITCNNPNGKNFFITNTNKATLNLGANGYGGNLTVYAGATTKSALISIDGSAVVNIYDGTVLDGSDATFVATSGGVNISGDEKATLNMYGGEIKNCRGTLGGAVGMYMMTDNGSFVVFDSRCNAVFNMYGGTISDCVSTGRLTSASSRYLVAGGGAVCIFGSNSTRTGAATFNMDGDDCLITGCSTNVEDIYSAGFDVYGGAISVGGGVVTLKKGEITNNTVKAGIAKAAYGGGIGYYYGTTATITIENNFKLYGNSADTAGDDIARETANGALTLLNIRPDTFGILYPEQTGGKWHKDEEGNRCKGDKETEIPLSSPSKDLKGSSVPKYIKVVRQEAPAPTPVYKITFKDAPHGNILREIEVEQGDLIQSWIPAKEGYVFIGWIDEYFNRLPAIAKADTTYYAQFCLLEGVGTPGRLLDLYGEGQTNNSDAISKGGAKTVRWCLEFSGLSNRINASSPIKAGTKITMAYYPNKSDRSVVDYYYLILKEDRTSISMSEFTVMGGSENFVSVEDIHINETICQFSFEFPEEQNNTTVWMSYRNNHARNESAVDITFAETGLSEPSGTLEANGNTVTVSNLTGFKADQSDSRHNTLQALADRKAVLVVEAVDAQGRTVAMSGDTVVKVGGKQAKVSNGIAAAKIAEGNYTIEVSALQYAVEFRISLCYTYNNIIYKPMMNVLTSVTVKP